MCKSFAPSISVAVILVVVVAVVEDAPLFFFVLLLSFFTIFVCSNCSSGGVLVTVLIVRMRINIYIPCKIRIRLISPQINNTLGILLYWYGIDWMVQVYYIVSWYWKYRLVWWWMVLQDVVLYVNSYINTTLFMYYCGGVAGVVKVCWDWMMVFGYNNVRRSFVICCLGWYGVAN